MFQCRTTRLWRSGAGVIQTADASLFVRIQPIEEIEKPIELADVELLIGRDVSCKLRLNDDSVSRRHAAIQLEGDCHCLYDLHSTNGTFVNEERLVERRVLQNGDQVRVGNQVFKYLKSDRVEVQYHELVFKLMTTDNLTSTYNKRYFLEALEREIGRATRSHSSFCLMMLDLDRFKSVNDIYGHLAGDSVLVEFARRAKSVLRSGEILARYGGEEFAMFVTRDSLEEAVAVAEEIRQITCSTPIVFDDNAIPVTVSIGVKYFDGLSDCNSTDLLAAADEMLYLAKREGRNQVQYERAVDDANVGVSTG